MCTEEESRANLALEAVGSSAEDDALLLMEAATHGAFLPQPPGKLHRKKMFRNLMPNFLHPNKAH